MAPQARTVSVAGGMPLAIFRARQWVHFLALPLASSTGGPAPFLLAALLLGYAYGLNAISDRATDLDARKNPLAAARVCPRSAVIAVLAAGAAAVALGALGGRMALLSTAVSLLCASAYSVGPRGKRFPVLGTLLNVGIFAPLLWLDDARPASFAAEVLVFAVVLMENQLLHERADAVEDAAAHVLTTARVLGARGTAGTIIALAAAGLAALPQVAPSRSFGVAMAVAILAPTLVALVGPRDLLRRRFAHRWIAFVAGAVLFWAGR